jgi:acetyl-CoA C-acetyltransferase
MKLSQDVFVLSAKRTAIGGFLGGLSSVPPTELATQVSKSALAAASVEPSLVGHAVFGNVIHTEPRDMYLSRVAALQAGLPTEVPALTLNRLCGSGLQAVISAIQGIVMDGTSIALAGGAESMSRAVHATNSLRGGQKMGELALFDMMVGALTDPFGNGHMGMTAENVAARYGIDRERQDAFAVESHRRASAAQKAGRFDGQIVPIEITAKREAVRFDRDEHIRHDANLEGMAGLRPVFRKDGVVTAGNSSGINDGAAAIVLADGEGARVAGAQPMARVLGYAHAGVAPDVMGIGPVPAVSKLLKDLNLVVEGFDVIESNEAFAAQACAVSDELRFPVERTNPNGGAIALGHPIGATGAILVVKAVHELLRIKGGRALVTMCIGGGQGIALALERV